MTNPQDIVGQAGKMVRGPLNRAMSIATHNRFLRVNWADGVTCLLPASRVDRARSSFGRLAQFVDQVQQVMT